MEFDTFENILKSSDKENLKEWKRLLWLCANLYNALPYRTQKSVYLAVFAAAVTGNPHAFDQGTAEEDPLSGHTDGFRTEGHTGGNFRNVSCI